MRRGGERLFWQSLMCIGWDSGPAGHWCFLNMWPLAVAFCFAIMRGSPQGPGYGRRAMCKVYCVSLLAEKCLMQHLVGPRGRISCLDVGNILPIQAPGY